MSNKLWTRDFTIITLGSVVSMLGNSIAGFAMSLFVLDYTDSPLYYAIYLFLYTLPQIVAPMVAGPLMDRFSRRRTIYLLDFASTVLYLTLGIILYLGLFNFGIFAAMTFLIGTIHSVYMVAFDSFYPLLVTEGNFSKAYSVSSTLETLTYIMIPVATFVYKAFGLMPLLLVNSLCFLTAATFETRISDVESAKGLLSTKEYSCRKYIVDIKEGVTYLYSEKGLFYIVIYFTFASLAMGASQVITLPWFKTNFNNGEYVYMTVWGMMVIGRVLGGMAHYRLRLPVEKKFLIALFCYVGTSLLEGSYLYFPLRIMPVFCFFNGIMGVTSYNIRVSSTQSYVPDERKGRFNGTFLMLNTVGTLSGELLAGVLALYMPSRSVLSLFMGICALSALVFIAGGKKHVRPIYNRNQ